MTYKDDLLKEGLTEQDIDYVGQGFLELLSGQLSSAARHADHAVDLFESKQPDKVLATLQTIEQEIEQASRSHEVASLLMEKDKDCKQTVLS